MPQSPSEDTAHEVICPHCGKAFTSELLSGTSESHQGFKCPHCRLFVARDRADEPGEPEAD